MATGGGQRWVALVALACSGGACGPQSLGGARLDAGRQVHDAGPVCGDAFAMPPPSPTPPDTVGCFEGNDAGWVQVPCLCELPIENDTSTTIDVILELIVTPATPAPTLTGSLDIEIAFDDPGAGWYDVLAGLAGNGSDFAATNQGGTTTVRMANSAYVLGILPLAPCEARHLTERVTGSYDTTLTVRANLSTPHNGGLGTVVNSCTDLPPELLAVTPSTPRR